MIRHHILRGHGKAREPWRVLQRPPTSSAELGDLKIVCNDLSISCSKMRAQPLRLEVHLWCVDEIIYTHVHIVEII